MSEIKFNPPTVLVAGCSGQVGKALVNAFNQAGFTTVGMTTAELDITSEASVQSAISAVQPNFVVNAARFPDVDKAETEGDTARKILLDGPINLAMACQQIDAVLIHLSSEYVFDGDDAPYSELDTVSPLNLFGHYCNEAESEIRFILPRHIVIRVGLVFSEDPRRFVAKTLRDLREGRVLRMVSDEVGTPTSANDLARVITAQIRQLDLGSEAYGIYHYGGGGSASWFEMGELIYAQALQREDLPSELLQPIRGEDIPSRRRGQKMSDWIAINCSNTSG